MTLEQSGRAALYAASSGNLDELRDALQARDAAIERANQAEPSDELRACLLAAVETGEAIRAEICSLKSTIVSESARLAQAQTYVTEP